jgi:hypothetical protein
MQSSRRSPFAGDALAVQSITKARIKSVSCASGARVTSLLLVQKRSNQEKTTPRLALAAQSLGGKSVSRGRAFRRHIHVPSKRHRHRADARYAACRPRLTAAQGARRAGGPSLTRTRCAPAPPSREQEKQNKQKSTKSKRAANLPAFREVRAGCAPALRGPLCGGEGRTIRPAGGSTRRSSLFRPDRSPAEKPGRPSRTFRAGCPESAKRGGLSLGLLSLWPRKEKVTRAPSARETLFKPLIRARAHADTARASPASGLPQKKVWR